MISDNLKKTLVERISRLCGKCSIYLFGSYAYGTPTESSDLDIAVIMDHVDSSISISAKLWDTMKDISIPKDFVVASQAEFEFYRKEPGSLFRTIAEKGVRLNVT